MNSLVRFLVCRSLNTLLKFVIAVIWCSGYLSFTAFFVGWVWRFVESTQGPTRRSSGTRPEAGEPLSFNVSRHMNDIFKFTNHVILSIALMLAIPSNSSAECLPDSVVPIQVREARIVALGEMHGTMEAQKFTGDLLCSLASHGRSIILGLEIPSSEQPQIDAYVAGGAEDNFLNSMASSPFWNQKFQNGLASSAMADLIKKVRALRAEGMRVRINAIDRKPKWYELWVTRDEIMAQNIQGVLIADPSASILFLAGNAHTKKTVGSPFNASYKSAIHLIREKNLVTLLMQYTDGTAWYCFKGESICRPKTQKSYLRVTQTPKIIELVPSLLPDYDGYFFVGAITASPPAVDRLLRNDG